MRSRVTPSSCVIAWPIFCTSLGERCFRTCAASSSPTESRRIALLARPTSLILVHPRLDDVGDDLRILAGDAAGADQRILLRGGDRGNVLSRKRGGIDRRRCVL